MRRRLIIAAVVITLLGGAGVLAWNLSDMPPLGFVLRYGYPSPMGPTGQTMEIAGVEFVEISPGYFRMGSHYTCDGGDLLGRISAGLGLAWGRQPRHLNECPVHWVEFPCGFWIARTEVTNEQYERFDPKHLRSEYSPENRMPKVEVSWEDATLYCAWLANRCSLPVRLPTESEWECACRAGSRTEYCFGDDARDLSAYAWFGHSSDRTSEVGTRRPNSWGLRDLHGNAVEWCADNSDDGRGGIREDRAIVRGGGWDYPAQTCRSAFRYSAYTSVRYIDIGFRPAFTLPPEE